MPGCYPPKTFAPHMEARERSAYSGFEDPDWARNVLDEMRSHASGQIIATSHDLGPQKVAKEGKWDPLFQDIQGNLY